MKKVININFQGRVIPIEETAYEILQQYINSLRDYFSKEEGREEIINDIESRIAELFAEQLKKETACITDADITSIMNSMGRPSDFEQEEAEYTAKSNYSNAEASDAAEKHAPQQSNDEKKRLYRDEEDKILGGVASGLANYLHIDPAIMRIAFAIMAFFGGFGFLVYIVLWIALPSKSLVTSIRKRLYRDTEGKVFGGVCGGLAKYFDISVAIPRVIFAAPFIFGLITSIGRNFFMSGPVYIGGFSGGTFIIIYIILWIVLPEAITAAEKLEMKGEKIDLNSIRDTIMEDLHGFRGRTKKMKKEFRSSAQDILTGVKTAFDTENHPPTNTGTTAHPTNEMGTRRRRHGLGNAIGILLKAFIIFIAGITGLALFILFIVLLGSGVGYVPLKDFLLDGTWQNLFAWGTLLFFIGVPVIAFITWIIRQLMRIKKRNRYISYAFSALWVIGWFSLIALFASVSKNFHSLSIPQPQDIAVVQPSDKLIVTLRQPAIYDYNSWLDLDGAISVEGDSLHLNTVRLNVVRSTDSNYHLYIIRISRGNDNQHAKTLAEKINFPVEQKGNTIYLPESFGISKHDKWRNQRVLVVVEVPTGKKIRIDESLDEYDYFHIDLRSKHNRRNGNIPRDWEYGENWEYNEDMIMTTEDLVSMHYKRNNDENKVNDETNDDDENIAPPPMPKTPKQIEKIEQIKDTLSVRHSEIIPQNNGMEQTGNNINPKKSVEMDAFSPLTIFLH